jgi:hypothetical protein
MMGKMVTIKVDGTMEVLSRESVSLEDVQKAVGGYIEAVPLFNTYKDEECQAWCDEEGKLKGYEPNIYAQKVWAEASDAANYDQLVGNIVILTGDAMLD